MKNAEFDRISVRPDVCHGKPCVKGTRIMVDQVLDLVEQGKSFSEVIEGYYPDLTVEDVKACIRLARHLLDNEDIHVVDERRAG